MFLSGLGSFSVLSWAGATGHSRDCRANMTRTACWFEQKKRSIYFQISPPQRPLYAKEKVDVFLSFAHPIDLFKRKKKSCVSGFKKVVGVVAVVVAVVRIEVRMPATLLIGPRACSVLKKSGGSRGGAALPRGGGWGGGGAPPICKLLTVIAPFHKGV